jgi:hypothetical protein
LEARGLDKKVLVQELRERVVAMYIMQEGGLPPVLTPRGGPVTNVQLMICSFNAMVCRLMSSSVTQSHIKDVERHIHIILNCFEVFDMELRVTKETPTWTTSYNFLCLLNLPDMLQKFGPLQIYGKGGTR